MLMDDINHQIFGNKETHILLKKHVVFISPNTKGMKK